MENKQQQGATAHPNKSIQQENTTADENGKPGTSYAEDTQMNKDKADELADEQENGEHH